MNYISEINEFYNWIMLNPIPADAQALWHVLMQINNRNAVKIGANYYWRVQFTVSNSTLLSILAFSRQQLNRMRNVLIQQRRIVYAKGKGNQSGTYTIIPFDKNVVDKVVDNSVDKVWITTVSHNVAQTVTQTVTQTDTQMLHKADTNGDLCNIMCTLDKHNSNNIIYNNISYPIESYQKTEVEQDDTIRYDEIHDAVKEQIDFENLAKKLPNDVELINSIVEIMTEILFAKTDNILISGGMYPTEMVKNRYRELDDGHIEYVIDCMNANTTDIRNVKKYLSAALFNAPATMDAYYQNKFAHDLKK